MYKDRS